MTQKKIVKNPTFTHQYTKEIISICEAPKNLALPLRPKGRSHRGTMSSTTRKG